ncbi:MAG: hypothetical protein JNK79_20010 [Chitinophagaceae bacterium]|nr:hypothetical protein [Chitinophagaceae bacterium]
MKLFTLLIFAISSTCIAQPQTTYTLKGVVVDRYNTPISNCSVYEKATENASTTNNCGEFKYTTYENQITLGFNSTLFKPFEKKIDLKSLPLTEWVVFKLNTKITAKTNCNEVRLKGKVIKVTKVK